MKSQKKSYNTPLLAAGSFIDQGRPKGYYEDFLTGFLVEPTIPSTWGRPVGLLVMPDGSLLVTEEENGRIYRIQYQ
jgi:glucose/arabinose dehydrogenase